MQIWGCYAVADHLAPRAFVADVLLYERLVVPVPPPGDAAQTSEWNRRGWCPERQARLLDRLGALAETVPWTDERREEWTEAWSAGTAARDIENAAAIARASPGGVAPSAANATRAVVSLSVAQKVFNDPDVRAIAVYGDPPAFAREWRIERSLPFVRRRRRPLPPGEVEVARPEPAEQHRVAKLLVAALAVPEDSARSDEEMLERACVLATDERMARWRADFHAWVDLISRERLRDETIVREMGGLVEAYNRTVRRKAGRTVTRQTATLVAPAGLAALGPGALVARGPATAVATVVADRVWSGEPSPGEDAAALLVEARKRLRR